MSATTAGSTCRGLSYSAGAAIAPLIDNPATPDRTRYLLSPILFPAEKPSPG